MDKQEVQEMLNAMDAKKAEMEGGNRKFWSPPSKKEGTFPIRFLPPLKQKDEKLFFFTHKSHWLNGTSYECVNQNLVDKNGNEHQAVTCPICQFVKKLYNTAERDTEEWKLAGNLSAKSRYVYRVIVRGSEDETIPVFYENGKMLFEVIYHVIRETDYGIIVDPKNGRDFNIVKVGTGRRSRYEQSLPAANISPIFIEASDIKKCFEIAMNMDYNSLIEFVTPEHLEKELKEHLGVVPTSKQKKEEVSKPVEKAPELVEEKDNDEIDSILAEFTN